MRIRTLLLTGVIAAALCSSAWAQSPPRQPASGPGGADYSNGSVTVHTYGQGVEAYDLFEPASPTPRSAPVIVFTHGWGAKEPKSYLGWIHHIVKHGNIVIYPRYQDSMRTSAKEFTANALRGVQDAIQELQNGGHVRPDFNRFALVGHSIGGLLAANLAALAASNGLPHPRAVMSVEPGKTWGPQRLACPLEDLSQIPSDVYLVTVVGDSDRLARDTDAKRIYQESTRVPASHKNYVTLVSDDHGSPSITANHFAPCTGGDPDFSGMGDESASDNQPSGGGLLARLRARRGGGSSSSSSGGRGCHIDALDYYGTWKLFDGLYQGAFYGRNLNYALGNTRQQRYMGEWSDGTPVKELEVR